MTPEEAYFEYFGVEPRPDNTTINKGVLSFAEYYSNNCRGTITVKRRELLKLTEALPEDRVNQVAKLVRSLNAQNVDMAIVRLENFTKSLVAEADIESARLRIIKLAEENEVPLP